MKFLMKICENEGTNIKKNSGKWIDLNGDEASGVKCLKHSLCTMSSSLGPQKNQRKNICLCFLMTNENVFILL